MSGLGGESIKAGARFLAALRNDKGGILDGKGGVAGIPGGR